jgi:hypothetical protein
MSIDRRSLFVAGLGATVAGAGLARSAMAQAPMTPVGPGSHVYHPGHDAEPFSNVELVRAASGFFGAAAQDISSVIEKIAHDRGAEPTGYIAGTEVAGAVVVGLRYGKGQLFMKRHHHSAPVERVFWQGPSAGFDFGANASRTFTLVYGIVDPTDIFKRYPGVEGSFYVVGGFGVNYQRMGDITLAPIRAGVGGRAGANVGYLDYSRTRHISPF